jgi:hypothetical protein
MSTGEIAVYGKCDLKNALLQYKKTQEVFVAVDHVAASKHNLSHMVNKINEYSQRGIETVTWKRDRGPPSAHSRASRCASRSACLTRPPPHRAEHSPTPRRSPCLFLTRALFQARSSFRTRLSARAEIESEDVKP